MTPEQDRSERRRLLGHLAQSDCYAVASPLGCGRIALYREANGTSLGAGYAMADVVNALIAEGLVTWSGTGRAARLALCGSAESRPSPEKTRPEEVAAPQPVLDERESPLLWLYRRPGKDGHPQISDEEFAAGERFRADITLAQMLPRTTMNWDAASTPELRGQGRPDAAGASDSAVAARQRVRLACDKLGPELSGLVIDVCGFLKGLDLVEKERRWPARSAKVVLRVALATLATHYGLGRCNAPAGLRSWRRQNARPLLFPAAAE
ncbi:ATPase [Hyphomicrobiales bacterium]|nr:ATPase [Hyphomicrobiales bacterium]CAH1700870.1 ATPase [Hyphomicrobiales bacterium]CAI0344746.1 ATPase [Hyphomicrobiales bacterium]